MVIRNSHQPHHQDTAAPGGVRLVDEGDLGVPRRHQLGAPQGADVPEQLDYILLERRVRDEEGSQG